MLHVWNYPFSNALDTVGIPGLRNRVMQPKPCNTQMSCYTTVENNDNALLLRLFVRHVENRLMPISKIVMRKLSEDSDQPFTHCARYW